MMSWTSFVRLSRDGVTVTIPMERLVSDPSEDIFAQPGDVLTLVLTPQTYSVLGATDCPSSGFLGQRAG